MRLAIKRYARAAINARFLPANFGQRRGFFRVARAETGAGTAARRIRPPRMLARVQPPAGIRVQDADVCSRGDRPRLRATRTVLILRNYGA